MARLLSGLRTCLLSVASILLLADWIHGSSSSYFSSQEAIGTGSVLFLDSNARQFLRPDSKTIDLQATSLSGSDLWSAVAVLLGIAPPFSMSASSASKLNRLLYPDPFNRPRSVLALNLLNLNADVLKKQLPEIFGAYSTKLYPFIGDNEEITKLSVDDVRVKYVTSMEDSYSDPSLMKHQLDDLVRILGGKYVNSSGGAVCVRLPTGSEYELSLSKKGDHDLVLELINLVKSVRGILDAQKELLQVPQIKADLLLGTLAGGSLESQASEVLLFLVSKLVHDLRAAYGGELVAILIMPTEREKGSVEDILGVDLSMSTSRLLAEESSDIAYEVEKLARNALVTITALILIVAALLGSYVLFNMPLIKDTLLYSGAKLD